MSRFNHFSRRIARDRHALTTLAATACLMLACSGPAQAYIGPGTGITAVGSVLALLAGVLLAIVGFLWFPVRRLLRRWRKPKSESGAGDQTQPAERAAPAQPNDESAP